MNPLLAVGAASAGANVVKNVLGVNKSSEAQATEESKQLKAEVFRSMLSKVVASPEVQSTLLLKNKGIGTVGDAENKLADLAQQIMQNPVLSEAVAGSSQNYELSFGSNGKVTVRSADGIERSVTLTDGLRASAEEAMEVLNAVNTSLNKSPVPYKSLLVSPGAKSVLQK